MSNIWLDVTTMLAWQRPAVGIVRTEAECAAYGLQQVREPVRFCRFDAVGGYREIDPAEVRAALDRIYGKPVPGTKVETPVVQPVQGTSLAPMEQRFKARLLRLIYLLPAKLRVPAFNFAVRRKDAFGAALRGYRELRQALKLFVRPPQSGSAALPPQLPHKRADAPFGSGDVYVSMGMDWDQKDLPYLFEQKRKLGFRVLLFCYDVIPVTLPHLCVGDVAASFARYFANVAWCADDILCISECTRRDLQGVLSELGTPVPPLSVIKLGCQLPVVTSGTAAAEVAEVLGQRYILFVSTIERRKNHETLYRAYTRLVDRGEKNLPLLIFVGMPGWGVNDLLADLRFDPRTQDLIRMLNHVTDTDLAKLYQHALFTVFPSLYEGWGLPVAESMAAGKFCLASNAASIPEAGGDLIEYIDPWDVPAWAERLRWYIGHPEDLSAKEQRIKDEYIPATWISCAACIFETAVGGGKK